MKQMFDRIFVCLMLIFACAQMVSGAVLWTEEQTLLSFDATTLNAFGCSVVVDNDTALIGAYTDTDEKGAVYVFIRKNSVWMQQAKLVASDGAQGDQFGYSVSLSGHTALIGARGDENNTGAVYVFQRMGNTWKQQAKLTVSSRWTHFGNAVSLDGNTALISASFDDQNHGAAYIFTCTDTNWTQDAKLLASDGASMDFFGWSISLSGDTALIGAGSGAYVFIRSGTAWVEQTKLLDSEISEYTNLYVSLENNTALIGSSTGNVYVFTRTNALWSLQQELFASDYAAGFGCCVSLSGDTALIGAFKANGNVNNSGASYVFMRSDSRWMQQYKLFTTDGVAGDYFGSSVWLENNTAFIAASFRLNMNNSVYVFTRTGELTPFLAEFTWMPSNPQTNETITFDASTSNTPNRTITRYEWDWNNDGSYEDISLTPTATHLWNQSGNFSVTLRITDTNGAVSTQTMTIPITNQGIDGSINNNGTPGFEGIFMVIAICVTILLYKKRK